MLPILLIFFGGFNPPKKPVAKKSQATKINTAPSQNQLGKLRKINDSETPQLAIVPSEIAQLEQGMRVEHDRFGYGEVVSIEGKGSDKKALIDFRGVGQKHLLLRFAKLKIKN